MEYPGDEKLATLLLEAGSSLTPAQLRELLPGVLAAPEGWNRDAWLELVAPRPTPALKAALLMLKSEVASRIRDDVGGADPARIVALRREMERRWLQGFIVPRADEHQGEYVAKRSERLAWLTGFTGSAGMAVVLGDRAALFVDGRYTIQAGNEVDPASVEVVSSSAKPADAWLTENLAAASQGVERPRVGYDPWLLTPEEAARFAHACEKAGGRLVTVEENLIDGIWIDQPPPPLAPVVPYGGDFADRLERLQNALAAEGADAAVIGDPASIAWLFGIRGGDVPYTPVALGFAIFESSGVTRLFMDRRKLTPGAIDRLKGRVEVESPARLGLELERLGGARKKVRVDGATVAAWIVRKLDRAGAIIQVGGDPCALFKARKSQAELDGIKAAHRRDGAALCRFLAWLDDRVLRERVTETSAAARMDAIRAENPDFRGPSFPTIAGFGANGAIVHYRPSPASDLRLETGGLFLLDSGGQYEDGTTDVTRTIAIGRPTAEMRDRFTRVLKGHIALAGARFPKGTSGSQLDVLARRHLWEAGIDYDHGTGHGVGCFLSVHEGPQRISKLPNRVALEPGMVLSVEPGYYKAGEFGIRIENLVAVKSLEKAEGWEKDMLGFEVLTLAPIDRSLIDVDMLDREERAWLAAYHERVRAELTPLVDLATAAWLKRVTGLM